MNTVQELESAVLKLPVTELISFRKWFEEFDAKAWDKQFEADVASKKLDKQAKQAISDFHAGKCKAL